MQESFEAQENRRQDHGEFSIELACGNQTAPQSESSREDGAQDSRPANLDRDQAPSENANQEFAGEDSPVSALTGDASRLPRAVVIPQRRPSDRARGFLRAYAPDLLRCGIDQATFLRFIDGLNKSVASNPAVEAVNLAGEAVGAVPGSEFVGAPIIGTALQVAAGAYKEVNARRGYVLFSLFLHLVTWPLLISQIL